MYYLHGPYMDPAGLSSFVACCLIALDKKLGVRPISIVETFHRLIAKAFYLLFVMIFTLLLQGPLHSVQDNYLDVF